ncbi:Protein MAIN-LIKE 2, partial [Camellia lanceoleosa]
MANDAPHDGGSPGMEGEPEYIPLPPRVRPFDPERYHLLLREPESHLSHDASKVHTAFLHFPRFDSRFTRGYGSTATREWYMDLLDSVRQIIDDTGFGLFCMGLSRLMASMTLLGALVERWWDTTNSFHFSTTGDMTMTPYDFARLTGLEVGGQPIPYDFDMGEWEADWTYLLGAHPPIFRSVQSLLCTCTFYTLCHTLLSIFFVFYTFYILHIAHILCFPHYLCLSIFSLPSSCFSQLWIYAYVPALAPEPEVKPPLKVPYSHRYDGRCQPRARETLSYLRQYFDTFFLLSASIHFAYPMATYLSMHLLSAGHMAALGNDARWGQISFYRSLGVCVHTGRADDIPSSSRARVADVPSTSRARAANAFSTSRARVPRGEARGMPPTRQSVGWLDLPTELTGWRYFGVPYQIPLKPPLPDHRYVRTPDSPPPSIEYVEGLLEVLASFEGMILRRDTMLSFHGIQ